MENTNHCTLCNKTFPTRADFELHCLFPGEDRLLQPP